MKSNNQFLRYWYHLINGKKAYEKVRKQIKEGEIVLYYSSFSLGDYYLLSLIIKAIVKSYGQKGALIVIPSKVLKLCLQIGLDRVCVINGDRDFADFVFYSNYSINKNRIVNIYPWLLFNLKSLTTVQTLIEKPALNHYSEDEFFIQKLKKNKTIVLSPYEQTISILGKHNFSINFWEKLAQTLLNKGYSVCTNCSNNNSEPCIKGTLPIFPSLSGVHKFVELAGFVISIRSGFSDVICMANAKKIILYPDKEYFNLFSCSLMFGPSHNIFDVVYDGSEEAVLSEISKIV